MSFDPITAALQIGESLITRLFPDPHEQARERMKLAELAQQGDIEKLNAHVQLMLGQLEVNKTEAQHRSVFVAGWRPAVGWLCASVLAFNYIGVYLMEFFSTAPVPERFDMSELYPILFGMLGIGGLRSYDKKNGTQTNSIKSKG